MLKIADGVFVGDLSNEKITGDITAILNVAVDLPPTRCWPKVTYLHVGLVDGPGNPIPAYCAAVLSLVSLVQQKKTVLVCCHGGYSRSVAVALMYLSLTEGKHMERVDFLRRWTWNELFKRVVELNGVRDLPTPHRAHIEAFNALPFAVLEALC